MTHRYLHERVLLMVVAVLMLSVWTAQESVAQIAAGTPVPLLGACDPSYQEDCPAWSPDGNSVVFAANKDGNWDIYKIPASGGAPVRLTTDPAPESFPSYSPDGRRIVYRRGDWPAWPAQPLEIWVMNADGSGQERLTTGSFDEEPSFSPDGSKILFHSKRSPVGSGSLGIFTMNPDGTGITYLGQQGASPSWSRDGAQLAWEQYPNLGVWVMNADGSNPHQCSPRASNSNDGQPTWSPTGCIGYTVAPSSAPPCGQTGLGIINGSSCQDQYQAVSFNTGVQNPAWSPDGSKIAYMGGCGTSPDIYVMAVGGCSQQVYSPVRNSANGHWYQVVPISGTMCWTDARDEAVRMGGYLATVNSQQENDFLLSLNPPGTHVAWIGGSDAEQEGVWKWVTGETFYNNGQCTGYCNWGPGEPNNGTVENFLELWVPSSYQPGKWNNGTASDANNRSFIVEYNNDPNQTPSSDAFCENFDDGASWRSRWISTQGGHTLVNTPTPYSGTGAIRTEGIVADPPHSMLKRDGFVADAGVYSVWFYQTNVWGGAIYAQVDPSGDPATGAPRSYRMGFNARDGAGGGVLDLTKIDNSGNLTLIFSMPSPQYVRNQWVRFFFRNEGLGQLHVGYEVGGNRSEYPVVDPTPLTQPGGFYLQSNGTNYFDDVSYDPDPNSSGCGGEEGISELFLVGNSQTPLTATCGELTSFDFVVRNIGSAQSSPQMALCSLIVLDRCNTGAVNSFWCKFSDQSESINRDIFTAMVPLPAIAPFGSEAHIQWPEEIRFVSPHYTDHLFLKLTAQDGVGPLDQSGQYSIENYFTNFFVATNPDAYKNCAFELLDVVANALRKAKGILKAAGVTVETLAMTGACLDPIVNDLPCIQDANATQGQRAACAQSAFLNWISCFVSKVAEEVKQKGLRASWELAGIVVSAIGAIQTEFIENSGCASVFVDYCTVLRQTGTLTAMQVTPGGAILFLLCCPADLRVDDSQGRTWIVPGEGEIEMPAGPVSAARLGDGKLVLADAGEQYDVSLVGRDNGELTFSLFVPYRDSCLLEFMFENVSCGPSFSGSVQDIVSDQRGILMVIDDNSDGIVDRTLLPTATSDSAVIKTIVASPSGSVRSGISLDIYDAQGSLVHQVSTDDHGFALSPELMAGVYSVVLTAPIGFEADQEIQEVSISGDTTIVSFVLTKLDITAAPRSRGFWGMQLQKALWNKPEQYTRSDFSRFVGLIGKHFNDNRLNAVDIYTVAQPATQNDSLLALKALLPLQPMITEEPFVKRLAKAELTALMLNVAAGKISQTQAITKDGMTVSQAITYCDLLINEPLIPVLWLPESWMPEYDHNGPWRPYIGANLIAGFINYGKMLPAGSIPADIVNIAYKQESEKDLPKSFSLSQNYPNPFNPNTQISFDLPAATNATLSVYNLLGQQVRVLVEGNLEAGSHLIEWDGRGSDGQPVASGVYLYRLQAGEFVETRKMMLLK